MLLLKLSHKELTTWYCVFLNQPSTPLWIKLRDLFLLEKFIFHFICSLPIENLHSAIEKDRNAPKVQNTPAYSSFCTNYSKKSWQPGTVLFKSAFRTSLNKVMGSVFLLQKFWFHFFQFYSPSPFENLYPGRIGGKGRLSAVFIWPLPSGQLFLLQIENINKIVTSLIGQLVYWKADHFVNWSF